MAYKFVKAPDANAIAERQFATAATLKFTKFTSCIGVVVLDGDTLNGVHLALTGGPPTPTKFNQIAAGSVIDLMGETYTKAVVFGCLSVWKNPANDVVAPYQFIIANLKHLTPKDLGDGTYTATISGSDIVIT